MKIFVGLGNPGPKYANNRHNIGFMALDEIARDHNFTPWRSKFQASLSEGRLGREKVVLLKPETFMNLSGQAVGEAMRFYKLTLDDITVFHDELDLAPGKCRVKQGGGHAGHNGLRSIHAHIGAEYTRVRMGIGHPGNKNAVASFVLHDFAKADEAWLDDVLRGLCEGAVDLAQGDSGKFMNAIGRRVNPPRSSKSSQTPNASAPTPAKPNAQPPTPTPTQKKPEEPSAERNLSPIQKLMDKFS